MLVFIFEFVLATCEIDNLRFGEQHPYLVECTVI